MTSATGCAAGCAVGPGAGLMNSPGSTGLPTTSKIVIAPTEENASPSRWLSQQLLSDRVLACRPSGAITQQGAGQANPDNALPSPLLRAPS